MKTNSTTSAEAGALFAGPVFYSQSRVGTAADQKRIAFQWAVAAANPGCASWNAMPSVTMRS
jgi:hypothetical protein